jgi:hypothetical protein
MDIPGSHLIFAEMVLSPSFAVSAAVWLCPLSSGQHGRTQLAADRPVWDFA